MDASNGAIRRRTRSVGRTFPKPKAEEVEESRLTELELAEMDVSKLATVLDWLGQPHTVSALGAVVLFIWYSGTVESDVPPDEEGLSKTRMVNALITAALVFLAYSSLQMRDSLMSRPHPAMWRLLQGITVLYLMSLTLLFVLSLEEAKIVLNYVFGSMAPNDTTGNNRSYAEDCRIYTPEKENKFQYVYEMVADIFTVAHIGGYLGKALVVRDWRILWVLCVVWELIEYSLQHMLPNFYECWWDHWVYDIGCNFLGMALGMGLVRCFDMSKMDWTGFLRLPQQAKLAQNAAAAEDAAVGDATPPRGITTRKAVGASPPVLARDLVGRAVFQLTPDVAQYHWQAFSSLRRFAACVLIIFFILGLEFNAFTLKHVLGLPPESPINFVRMVYVYLLLIPVGREWYSFFIEKESDRIGPNMWLLICVLLVETMVWVKFGMHPSVSLFDNAQAPREVLVSWLVIGCGVVAWLVLRFNRGRLLAQASKQQREWAMRVAAIVSVGGMVYLAITQDVYLGSKGAGIAGDGEEAVAD